MQRYLRKHHRPHRETFIPLGHLPGQRLEADFGHIYVDFPDGRRQVPFLVAAWAYSNAPFVIALPCERTEAILHGMVAAFEFFGAVAKEVWWDNPKTVATLVLKGRERQLHPRYAALASHYVFDPRCCMPARGNEKPDAEGTVKAVQRRFATPVPRVADRDELNLFFRKCCEAERERTVGSETVRIWVVDRFASCSLRKGGPSRRTHAVTKSRRWSSTRSTISRRWATSRRALDHAPVFRDWALPACFTDFRAALEKLHGAMAGARRYVRVLQLLGEHPLTRVRKAIDACISEHLTSAEAVIQRTRSFATIEATTRTASPPQLEMPGAAQVQVPLPDLNCYDQFLGARKTINHLQMR